MPQLVPRTMILLDPDLDPGLPSPGAAQLSADRLPSARTLSAFLQRAQAAVRLRGQVSVLLTTDRRIRRLNRQFRGKNQATDVLSFPAERESEWRGPEKLAGDLAISVETARKQAAGQGHGLSIEIKVLMLHGLLHLAGYDHETDQGEMARRERTLRARLKLPLGLIERATDSGRPTLAPATGRKSGKPGPKVRRTAGAAGSLRP
ncbi:MAG: rRNA maturation RNase YbeY [Acidobacteriota bacterium]